MNPEVRSGIIVMLGYLLVVMASSSLVLWVQRIYFLHPDEDQAWFVPGIAALGSGIIYFWVMVQIDV